MSAIACCKQMPGAFEYCATQGIGDTATHLDCARQVHIAPQRLVSSLYIEQAKSSIS